MRVGFMICLLIAGSLELSAADLQTEIFPIDRLFLDSVPAPSLLETKRSNAPGAVEIIDAREFLESQGVTFPDGSSAYYLPQGSILVMRSTAANLDIVRKFCSDGNFMDHRFHARIILAYFPTPKTAPPDNGLDYEALRKSAGAGWRETSVIELTGSVGTIMRSATTFGTSVVNFSESSDVRLPKISGASGVACVMLATLREGGNLQTKIAYTMGGAHMVSVQCETEATSRNGEWTVVQYQTVDSLSYALVLQITLENED